MARLDKASLREGLDTLKGQFERLCAEGKMGADSRALFQALLMLFELLMAVFMEKRPPSRRQGQGPDAHAHPLREHAHRRDGRDPPRGGL